MVANTPWRFFLALVLLSTLSLAVGCKPQVEEIPKPQATCKGFVEKSKLCESDINKETEAQFLKSCEAGLEKNKAEQEALLKCVLKEDCNAAKECIEDTSKDLAIAQAMTQIQADVKDKKFDAPKEHPYFNVCLISLTGKESKADHLSEPFKKACGELFQGFAQARHDEYVAMRDASEAPPYKACYLEYRDLVTYSGGDVKGAESLCKELEQVKGILSGKNLAAKYLTDKNASEIPFECLYRPDQLEALGTEWSKKQRDELIQACFVELGPMIFEARKSLESSCGDVQKRLYDLYKKYNLKGKSPALDTQFERFKASGKCEG